jgi:hypothetical protein
MRATLHQPTTPCATGAHIPLTQLLPPSRHIPQRCLPSTKKEKKTSLPRPSSLGCAPSLARDPSRASLARPTQVWCWRRWWWMLVVLVRRHSPLTLTLTVGIDRHRRPLPYVVNICFKCVIRFTDMLQLFHMDVTKVDIGILHMLQVFQGHVARVCYKCFIYSKRILQSL